MELSEEFGPPKKIQTVRSLYCAGPNDHQVTSTFVKLSSKIKVTMTNIRMGYTPLCRDLVFLVFLALL